MSELTIFKTVPLSRQTQYENLGWSLHPSFESAEDSVQVLKKVKTNSGHNDHIDSTMKRPYLIQRARINRPLGQYEGLALSKAVDLDYMGSAEFEFGALPRSFRKIEAQWSLYKQHKFEDIVAVRTDDARQFQLRVYANFDTDAAKEQYRVWLRDAFAGKLYLKESLRARLSNNVVVLEGTDFWWDIQNDVMFSFDKQFMNRLESHLRASFEVLNAAK